MDDGRTPLDFALVRMDALRRGKEPFTSEWMKRLNSGLPPKRVDNILGYLERSGFLRRLDRGQYQLADTTKGGYIPTFEDGINTAAAHLRSAADFLGSIRFCSDLTSSDVALLDTEIPRIKALAAEIHSIKPHHSRIGG